MQVKQRLDNWLQIFKLILEASWTEKQPGCIQYKNPAIAFSFKPTTQINNNVVNTTHGMSINNENNPSHKKEGPKFLFLSQ